MAVQNFRKVLVYRYKLIKELPNDTAQVAGVNLTKEFTDFKSVQESLIPFIKSSSNLTGFIDFEKKDLMNGEIIQQSTYTGDVPDIIAREVLNAMERFELVPIAKYYNIDVVQKDKNMLVKMIIEYQNKRIEAEKPVEEEKKVIQENITNNEIKEPIINPVNDDDDKGFFSGFNFGKNK